MPEKFKLVMLGQLGVGKSALTVKYLAQRFITDYDPYLEGKYSKIDILNNEPILVKVWDTYLHSGSIIELDKYVKWCDGVVVVYSTTSKSSLAEARAYLKHINIQCRTSGISLKPIILVGNKADLEHLRHVSYKDGKQLADSFGSLFHECSAAGSLHDVESAFQVLIRAVQQDRMLSSTATSIASHSDLRSLTGSLPKAFLRTKSGKSTSPKLLKKSSSTLKLFNKSFKFFT